jgi:nicotinate-nucleotide adenylyltransferase
VRTGILGGTFDPIHIGHLHTAESALHQLGLDRVLIVPAGDPWQKSDRRISKSEHRVEMCRLGVTGVEGIEVDVREVERDGPTYTIDTFESFPDEEDLLLIVGADTAANLGSWHRWIEVAERATIAIAPRRGAQSPQIPDALSIEMGLLEVSGTDIRARARAGEPFRFLVTERVHEYIARHGLYAKDPGDDIVEDVESMESSS